MIGFGLVPVVVIPLLWGVLMNLQLWLGYVLDSRLAGNWILSDLGGNPAGLRRVAMVVRCMDYTSVALVTLVFCWLTYRTAMSFKWTVTACAMSSLWALASYVSIQPHNLTVGAWTRWPIHTIWSPQMIRFVIPLVILGLAYIFQRHAAHRFRESVAG